MFLCGVECGWLIVELVYVGIYFELDVDWLFWFCGD